MASNSHIEWTDASWNCLAGCEAVSPGCANCYAATMTRRLEAMGQADYAGLTTAKHFNGTVRCLPHKLDVPLRWRKPRRVFVNSMSDLFHEDVPDEFIDRVFAVMALCPQHTFQVLTKRAERMQRWVSGCVVDGKLRSSLGKAASAVQNDTIECDVGGANGFHRLACVTSGWPWPMPNVWLGVSAERQQEADERIPWLLKTPAAVRFVSAEPLLAGITFNPLWFGPQTEGQWLNTVECGHAASRYGINWIIVGGESGHRARPCRVEWVQSIIDQCTAASVPVFCKQLGAQPEVPDPRVTNMRGDITGTTTLHLKDKKGGDESEWPESLRVRQFPGVTTNA